MLARDLHAILAPLATAAAAARERLERVVVEVHRRDGFLNEARTPSGLRIALDEPVEFGGRGRAPDPAEQLLAALGASLSVTLTAQAALRGLPLDEVRSTLRGEMDVARFFAPNGPGRPGLLNATIELRVTTSMPRAAVRMLVRDALRASPVVQSLKRRATAHLVVARPAR